MTNPIGGSGADVNALLDEIERLRRELDAALATAADRNRERLEQVFHNIDDVVLLRKVLQSGRLTGHALADEIRANLRGEIEPSDPLPDARKVMGDVRVGVGEWKDGGKTWEPHGCPSCGVIGSGKVRHSADCAAICMHGGYAGLSRDCPDHGFPVNPSRGGGHSEFDPALIPDCPSCRVAHWPQCPAPLAKSHGGPSHRGHCAIFHGGAFCDCGAEPALKSKGDSNAG